MPLTPSPWNVQQQRARRHRHRRDFLPLLVALGCFGLIVLTLRRFQDDFLAEQAAARNRKLGARTQTESLTVDEERDLERVLRARIRDTVDLAALARACGLRETLHTGCTSHPVERRVYILGERHSGSNIAASLAYSNFELGLESPAEILKATPGGRADETVQREWGLNNHKHNVQADTGYYGGLAILAVRNPFDFIRSLHDQCYFCASSNKSPNIETFVSTPWTAGAHIDRTYRDVFHLRKTKICEWLHVASSRANCLVIVRAEDLVLPSTQEAFVRELQHATGWDLPPTHESIRVGSDTNVGRSRSERFSPRDYFTDNILFSLDSLSRETNTQSSGGGRTHENSKRSIVRAVAPKLDVAFETALGYTL